MGVSGRKLAREWSDSNDFCKGRGYSSKSFLWWSCQLRRGKHVETPSRTSNVRLARVIRHAPNASTVTTAILIEIEGARVAVSSGANAETLRTTEHEALFQML
jgi:hypothetical protein